MSTSFLKTAHINFCTMRMFASAEHSGNELWIPESECQFCDSGISECREIWKVGKSEFENVGMSENSEI